MTEPTTIYRTRKPRKAAEPRRATTVTDGNFALYTVRRKNTEIGPHLVEVRIDPDGEIHFDFGGMTIFLKVIE